jgi:hypothetical protein
MVASTGMASACVDENGNPIKSFYTFNVSGQKVWAGWVLRTPEQLNARPLRAWIDTATDCRESTGSEIVKFQVFTSSADVLRTESPSKSTPILFEDWLEAYNRFTIDDREPMVQVIAGGPANRRNNSFVNAFRIPSHGGQPETHPEAHYNPGNGTLVDAVLRPDVNGGGYVNLFVTVTGSWDELNEVKAQQLARQVTAGLQFPNIGILIRPDRWFIESPIFPLFDRSWTVNASRPLWVRPDPPVDYDFNRHVRCVRTGLDFTCTKP